MSSLLFEPEDSHVLFALTGAESTVDADFRVDLGACFRSLFAYQLIGRQVI